MPAGDGTGPMGMGPMSGRNAGYCQGYTMPGFMNPMPGRGMGFGRGRGGGGRGWRHQFYASGQPAWARDQVPGVVPLGPAPTAAAEIEMLRRQADQLEQTLEQLRQRLAELESTPRGESC